MTTGTGSIWYYPNQQSIAATQNNTAVAAPPVNQPLIFEPTTAFLAAKSLPQAAEIGIAVSAGPGGVFSADWGGANVYASIDNTTYVYQGEIRGQSRMGSLTAALLSYGGANPDTGNTLAISTVESNAELETVTSADAAAFRTLCIICDPDYTNVEYLSYQTASLTMTNAYNLTSLYRGLYGTSASSHAIGSLFARLDDTTFGFVLPPPYVGHTVYMKLQSFNNYNSSSGMQDLSTCAVYSFVPSGIGGFAYVKEVDTGTGLSGGPITGVGTISLNPIAPGDLFANTGTVTASPSGVTATSFLDSSFGTVQNTLIRRGASTWSAESLSAFLDESFSSVQGMILRRGASVWAAESPPLPYAQFMPSAPAASAIARLSVTEASAFAANFSGSSGLAKTASASTAITKVNVVHAGATTQIGSVTFSASTTATFGTTGGTAQSMAAGDLLEFVYPSSPDSTLADVAITLRATRS
jgi:hypothetical protein